MKIAAISDIHGNMEALRAVIDDIDIEGIDKILVCGDLAVAGPEPSEVIDCLLGLSKDKDITFILGNTDEMILKANEKDGKEYFPDDETMKAAVKHCQKVLRDDQIKFLETLPQKQTVRFGKLDVVLVHGSPRSISENIYPDLDYEIVRQMIEGQRGDIILCGHTHLPAVYRIDNQTVINTGSVGRPFTENPEACYAVIDYPDLNAKNYEISHKYVKYDAQATANKLMRLKFKGQDRLAKVILNPSERHTQFA
jgi:putative phosphoesterase